MLKRKTVFVVGAGASAEFNLPVGTDLAKAISAKLDVRFERGFQPISGDIDLFRNVTSGGRSQEIGEYQQAGWLIRDAIVLANSIDDFLDIYQHDAHVVLYGKAAIAKCILEAEAKSKLFFDPNSARALGTGATINFAACSDTWLIKLARLLAKGRSHANCAKFFEGCSFIVFNYDRCLEHFFTFALQRLYKIDDQEAKHLVSKADIHHPYGKAGDLDQVHGSPAGAVFGTNSADYFHLGQSGIKTYTETVENNEFRSAIAAAERIVFLGFAYHDQNLNLLAEQGSLQGNKTMLGTAFTRSNSDIGVIADQLEMLMHPNARQVARNNLDIRSELTASGLFDFYSKSL